MKKIFLVIGMLCGYLWSENTKEAHIPVIYCFHGEGYENGNQQNGIPLPNWYWYWRQTSANTVPHIYDPNPPRPCYGYYEPGKDYVVVTKYADKIMTNFPIEVKDGPDKEVTIFGMDTYGATLLHERAHMLYWLTYWGEGYDPRWIMIEIH